jgi:hypothetical protein
MNALLRISLFVAALGVAPMRLSVAAEDAADLADDAVMARFATDRLLYEKKLADETIKFAETNLQQALKQAPMLREKIAKLEKDLVEAREKLAEAKDDAERNEAGRRVKQLENDFKRDGDQLKLSADRSQKNETDIAAAKEKIPQLDKEVVAARTAADDAKARALKADQRHAAQLDPSSVAQKIDAFIDARLKSLKLPASPSVDDAEFLRRVSLDVVGSVPKYADVIAFLDDAAGDKRARAVDRLLADAAYGRNFAQRFCTVTTENGTSTLNQTDPFRNWLTESLNVNRRWDRMVRDMLSAEGRGYVNPAVLFTVAYRMNEQPDPALLVSAAGDYFLGLQIQCAQCHDHPYHEWKHADFWGMAAMFGRTRVLKGSPSQNRNVEYVVTDDDVSQRDIFRTMGIEYPDQLPGGRIGIPDPVNAGKVLQTVSARFLDATEPKLPERGNQRRAFAEWVTAKENPYFARATVNRIWAHFFGRGLVEPILNMHPDNEPTHPDVLELLADEFRRTDYDLKHLVRCLTLSRAYQRSSKPVAGNEQDTKYASHMAVKPLDSFVLIDSLAAVLGRQQTDVQRRRDDAALYDTRLPGGDPTKYTHSIPQVLRLMNSRDHADLNGPAQQAAGGKPLPEAIVELYLAVLARRPSETETKQMVDYVTTLGDNRRGLADVYWVLLNSAEFLVNH